MIALSELMVCFAFVVGGFALPRPDGSLSLSLTFDNSFPQSQGAVSAIPTHRVFVGTSGQQKVRPSHIEAAIGDIVRFDFLAINHSIAESSFDSPCVPDGPFDTNFFEFNPNNNTHHAVELLVTTTNPQWFFCRQAIPYPHCSKGMLFAINPGQHWAEFTGRAEAASTSSAEPIYGGTAPVSPTRRPYGMGSSVHGTSPNAPYGTSTSISTSRSKQRPGSTGATSSPTAIPTSKTLLGTARGTVLGNMPSDSTVTIMTTSTRTVLIASSAQTGMFPRFSFRPGSSGLSSLSNTCQLGSTASINVPSLGLGTFASSTLPIPTGFPFVSMGTLTVITGTLASGSSASAMFIPKPTAGTTAVIFGSRSQTLAISKSDQIQVTTAPLNWNPLLSDSPEFATRTLEMFQGTTTVLATSISSTTSASSVQPIVISVPTSEALGRREIVPSAKFSAGSSAGALASALASVAWSSSGSSCTAAQSPSITWHRPAGPSPTIQSNVAVSWVDGKMRVAMVAGIVAAGVSVIYI